VPNARARFEPRPDQSVGRAHPHDRRVSAVIPAKNEARNIAWVLERLPVVVDEVLLVDGRSTDGTIEVAREIRPDIVVVREMQPGKGAALRAGFGAASGDYIVMLDADGSMDPLEIPRFVKPLDAGADLVRGTRFSDGGATADMSLLRDAGNRALLAVANAMYGTGHSDLCYGFAAFRRSAVLSLGLDAVGFEIEAQLFLRAIRHGLRIAEVGSFEAPRRYGTSNLHPFRDGWRVLKTIVRERVRHTAMAPDIDDMFDAATEPDLGHSIWSDMSATSSPTGLPLIQEARVVVETVTQEHSR
jgi:glycosyltransferase involved in cell wall biosynthesis